jgi:hypothetical protein
MSTTLHVQVPDAHYLSLTPSTRSPHIPSPIDTLYHGHGVYSLLIDQSRSTARSNIPALMIPRATCYFEVG